MKGNHDIGCVSSLGPIIAGIARAFQPRTERPAKAGNLLMLSRTQLGSLNVFPIKMARGRRLQNRKAETYVYPLPVT